MWTLRCETTEQSIEIKFSSETEQLESINMLYQILYPVGKSTVKSD